MERANLEGKIEEYGRQFKQCMEEAQRFMQQANELTTRATRLEGAIQVLQLLLQEEE